MSKGRIVFFDATEVRREKMRNAAMGVKESKAVNPEVEFVDKNVTPPVVEPAPKAEVKVEKPEVIIEKPAPAAPAIAVSKEELEGALIAFVVEQTGYPEEMVEMDADLEGDLGIDSIKKAQLMGELNEKYHFVDVSAPADNDMSLDDFPTLGAIRDYLLSKAGGSMEGGNGTTSGSEVTLPKTEPKEEPAPASTPVSEPAPLATRNSQLVTVSKEELESALVAFVVEQTGYPEEMVEMDADLEGDLGIDSIKKAQLMGELNEKYHFVNVSAPADNDMSLDDFPTLASIRDYLLGKASGTGLEGGNETTSGSEVTLPEAEPEKPAPAPASASKASAQSPKFKDELAAFLINFVVEQTGYPEEMVEMDVDLEGDLGIDSIKKAQLFGELSEKYELVPLGDMSLDDFKTLRDIFNAILQCAR